MNWLICLILGPPVGKSEKEKLSLVQRLPGEPGMGRRPKQGSVHQFPGGEPRTSGGSGWSQGFCLQPENLATLACLMLGH